MVERYAYDPWGKRRNPADWTQDDTRTGWITDRGYTMHEHLSPFGGAGGGCIINMNGRVYDPLTAMFFSPDPFVQAPGNWLNYNRYGYAYGNPLIFSDPSGESFIWDLIVLAGKIIWNTAVTIVGIGIGTAALIGGMYLGGIVGGPAGAVAGMLIVGYVGGTIGIWVMDKLWWR